MVLSDEQIKKDIKLLQSSFNYITKNVGRGTSIRDGFQIIDPALVPEGLPAHTRSIAWVIEEVVRQAGNRLEKSDPNYKKITQFDEIKKWESDIDIIDYLILLVGSEKIYVNVKMHNIEKKEGKNDINQGSKVFAHFKSDPDFRFYYCVVNFEFTGKTNTSISFTKEQPTIFYIPWVKDVYVNPKNGHLQATYAKKDYSPKNVGSFLDLLEKQLNKTDVLKKQLCAANKKIEKQNSHKRKSHELYLKKKNQKQKKKKN